MPLEQDTKIVQNPTKKLRSLEAALASPTIPPEIVTSLLNLAEFMEHDEKALPLDYRTLGALAEKCHAFAKALHYKEIEFQTSPQTVSPQRCSWMGLMLTLTFCILLLLSNDDYMI